MEIHRIKKIIPVFLSLFFIIMPGKVFALSATLIIPEKYSDVKSGTDVYFETDIKWPENPIRRDLTIEYSITDNSGKEIAYSKVLKAIETQASFIDSITIPTDAKSGLYKIYATLSGYDHGTEESVAASFKVENSISSTLTYQFFVVGLLVLIAIFLIIQISLAMRAEKKEE